jgi:pimeloyl-ACP methyl ester carboxylesterase
MMANFVLVHGAWGGSWSWKAMAEKLWEAGHRVVNVDLTGLGLRKGELHPGITLSDHIDDVCAATEAAGFDRFNLVGHSYGGMVITGVATRLGARISSIVYVDAFLPKDGESLWDITGDYEHKHYIDTQKFKPGLVAPIMGAENEKIGRHPLLTLLEAVRFTGEEKKIARHIYIFAKSWEPTPFRRFFNEVKGDAAWEVHEADSNHDVMAGQPKQLLKILLRLAG